MWDVMDSEDGLSDVGFWVLPVFMVVPVGVSSGWLCRVGVVSLCSGWLGAGVSDVGVSVMSAGASFREVCGDVDIISFLSANIGWLRDAAEAAHHQNISATTRMQIILAIFSVYHASWWGWVSSAVRVNRLQERTRTRRVPWRGYTSGSMLFMGGNETTTGSDLRLGRIKLRAGPAGVWA